MAFTLKVQCGGEFSSPQSVSDTYSYLTNLSTAIPDNFPGLKTFEKVESGIYHWKFGEIAYQSHRFRIELLTKFIFTQEETIVMQATDSPYPHALTGAWQIKNRDESAEVSFQVEFEVNLPFPRLFKAMIGPIAEREIRKLFEGYLVNVEKSLAK